MAEYQCRPVPARGESSGVQNLRENERLNDTRRLVGTANASRGGKANAEESVVVNDESEHEEGTEAERLVMQILNLRVLPKQRVLLNRNKQMKQLSAQLATERAARVSLEHTVQELTAEGAARIALEQTTQELATQRAARVALEQTAQELARERAARVALEQHTAQELVAERAARAALERTVQELAAERAARVALEQHTAQEMATERAARVGLEHTAQKLAAERAARVGLEQHTAQELAAERAARVSFEHTAQELAAERVARIAFERSAQELTAERAARIASEQNAKELCAERVARIALEGKVKELGIALKNKEEEHQSRMKETYKTFGKELDKKFEEITNLKEKIGKLESELGAAKKAEENFIDNFIVLTNAFGDLLANLVRLMSWVATEDNMQIITIGPFKTLEELNKVACGLNSMSEYFLADFHVSSQVNKTIETVIKILQNTTYPLYMYRDGRVDHFLNNIGPATSVEGNTGLSGSSEGNCQADEIPGMPRQARNENVPSTSERIPTDNPTPLSGDNNEDDVDYGNPPTLEPFM